VSVELTTRSSFEILPVISSALSEKFWIYRCVYRIDEVSRREKNDAGYRAQHIRTNEAAAEYAPQFWKRSFCFIHSRFPRTLGAGASQLCPLLLLWVVTVK
jgi:hypothetical protein